MVGSQARLEREQHGGGGGDLRRGKRGAVGAAVLLGPAARVALFQAGRVRPRQRAWEQREHVLPRRGDVDVDVVPVREARHVARPAVGADAEHVRQRRRVAGEPPGLGRRVSAVSDRGHHQHRASDGVVDRAPLRIREAVDGRIVRVAGAREAQVDHLRTGADGPADRARLRARRDRAVVADDLRDEQARGRSEARDPGPVVRQRGDLAGDEGAVPLRVVRRSRRRSSLQRRSAPSARRGSGRRRSRSPQRARSAAAAGR